MKKIVTTVVVALASTLGCAQTTLWQTDTARHEYYRIPAIVAYDEQVIAFSDNRSGVTDATSWGDVGSAGNISIEVRRSKDGGRNPYRSNYFLHPRLWCATAGRGGC